MKKLIFLLILLPTVAFSQENLKKSAEDFITGYLKLWEDKKWDEILNTVGEDAQVIWPNHYVQSANTAVKNAVEDFKKNVTSDKIDVESISVEILSPASAFVTAMYMETTDRSGKVQILDRLENYLLELKDGYWKFKKYITQSNYPVIFSENVEKKFQTGILGPLPRFNGATSQMNSILLYFFEDYKKNGTSPAQLGKIVGSRFAKTWNQSRGFEGLASGFLWNLQTMSTYIEVLERTENTAKYKCNPVFTISERWNVTKQEALEYCQNAFGEIADYMGGTCLIVEDGKFWILTFNKK